MKYTFLVDLARVLVFPKEKSYLQDLNPLYAKGSVSKKFQFREYFVFNDELINFLQNLAENYTIYMYTSGTMQEDHSIKAKISSIFTDIFSASVMNLPKTSPTSYLELAKVIGKNPEEIIFIDDNVENISAASKAGMITIHFRDNSSLFQKIDKLIS